MVAINCYCMKNSWVNILPFVLITDFSFWVNFYFKLDFNCLLVLVVLNCSVVEIFCCHLAVAQLNFDVLETSLILSFDMPL